MSDDTATKTLDDKETAAGASDKSGRAVFTADGRTVWEWQTATGVFSQLSVAEQFARLEAAKLELVDVPPPEVRERRNDVAGRLARSATERPKLAAAVRRPEPRGIQALLRRLAG